ncbi:hypothetical protein ES703_01265 [subsurface metagenome]
MILLYVLDNFINDDCVLYGNSEDGLYILENIYNERPSLPYRAIGVGTPAAPEYICIDLGTYSGVEHNVTFVGMFNHNLTTLAVANDLLTLKGCDDACPDESGACDWEHSAMCYTDLTSMPGDLCSECTGLQPITDFRNLWHKVDCAPGYRYWMLEIVDQANSDGYIEIGELVLGQWQQFPRGILDAGIATDPWVRLSPGRVDGPEFFMGKQRTHWGQDWSTYYSECERFELTFTTQNDPCRVDAVHTFLKAVQRTGGRFVLVPDDTKPFCYYMIVDNLRDFADRLVYGRTRELREWRLKLKTLTEGVRLL